MMVEQSASVVSVGKVSEKVDKTHPADFYGLFYDSKPANKEEELKVKLCKRHMSYEIC